MEIKYTHKGKNKLGGYSFTHYDIVYKHGKEEPKDKDFKKAIRKHLIDVICREDQIKTVHKVYQYPGYKATLTNGHVVSFTVYEDWTTPKKTKRKK